MGWKCSHFRWNSRRGRAAADPQQRRLLDRRADARGGRTNFVERDEQIGRVPEP